MTTTAPDDKRLRNPRLMRRLGIVSGLVAVLVVGGARAVGSAPPAQRLPNPDHVTPELQAEVNRCPHARTVPTGLVSTQ